jgi:uncharacterized protein (DUF1786 family)
MENYPTIKYIELLSDYRIFAIFDDGSIRVYSLDERLKQPHFKALKEGDLFYKATIANGGHGIIWNDELDLSEYELWTKGQPVSTVEQLAAQA